MSSNPASQVSRRLVILLSCVSILIFGLLAVPMYWAFESRLSRGHKILFWPFGGSTNFSMEEIEDHFRALAKADPVADAQRAYRLGDLRFVSWMGTAPRVPGMEGVGPPISLEETKMIGGGGDYFRTDEEMENAHRALYYAKDYNQELRRLIDERGKPLLFRVRETLKGESSSP